MGFGFLQVGRVFDETTAQADVYEVTTKSLLDSGSSLHLVSALLTFVCPASYVRQILFALRSMLWCW